VISEAFRDNLIAKGVPAAKIERIRNPSSRYADAANDIDGLGEHPPKVLAMGNIGHSQGLERIVEAWEANEELAQLQARLAGRGVAADGVRARIRSSRVQMPGVLYGPDLEPELRGASIGLVSQRADITEFNLPSKLMNYLAYGIPVIASVKLGSETARIVEESGAGWVTDAAHPEQFTAKVAQVLADRAALKRASDAGFAYAKGEFAPRSVAARFEALLETALA
jgi:colanic acid biosynthesis glycosyl transferase WcaI